MAITFLFPSQLQLAGSPVVITLTAPYPTPPLTHTERPYYYDHSTSTRRLTGSRPPHYRKLASALSEHFPWSIVFWAGRGVRAHYPGRPQSATCTLCALEQTPASACGRGPCWLMINYYRGAANKQRGRGQCGYCSMRRAGRRAAQGSSSQHGPT